MSLNDISDIEGEVFSVTQGTGMQNVPEFGDTVDGQSPHGKDIAAIEQACLTISTAKINKQTVVDMNDVVQSMAIESGVCQSDFILIKDTFGKDCLGDLSIKSFTSTPTKTNYNYVLNRTRRVIAAENQKVKECLLGTAQQLQSDVSIALARVNETYLPNVRNSIQLSMSEYPALANNINNGVFIIMTQLATKDQHDVSKMPLEIFPRNIFNPSYNAFGSVLYSSCFQKLFELGKWEHVRMLAYSASTSTPYANIIKDPSVKQVAKAYVPTVKDLVYLCCSDRGLRVFDSVQELITSVQNSIKDINIEESSVNQIEVPTLDILTEQLHHAKEAIASCFYVTRIIQIMDLFYPFLDQKSA